MYSGALRKRFAIQLDGRGDRNPWSLFLRNIIGILDSCIGGSSQALQSCLSRIYPNFDTFVRHFKICCTFVGSRVEDKNDITRSSSNWAELSAWQASSDGCVWALLTCRHDTTLKIRHVPLLRMTTTIAKRMRDPRFVALIERQLHCKTESVNTNVD